MRQALLALLCVIAGFGLVGIGAAIWVGSVFPVKVLDGFAGGLIWGLGVSCLVIAAAILLDHGRAN